MAFVIPLLFFAAPFTRPADGLIVSLRPSASDFSRHVFSNCCTSSHRRRNWALRSGNNTSGFGNDNGSEGGGPLEMSQQSFGSGIDTNYSDVVDPSFRQIMSMMGTSPRRIFLSLASSTTIALAANFLGITSNVLSALPEKVVEKSGLDIYYPRGDYKRVVVRGINDFGIPGGRGGACSFLIPKEWVADTSLALEQARRRARPLDYSMTPSLDRGRNSLPDAAYGPPGRLDDRGLSNEDTNVSVILNNGLRNFSLASSLSGDPTSAAELLLSSRPNAKLVSAAGERRGDGNVPVYQFEYTVDRGGRWKLLRAVSVVAGSLEGDVFVTLTVVSPSEEWEKPAVGERLRRVAESFKLV